MWSKFLKCCSQMVHQVSSPEHDVLPMGSKEFFVKGFRGESKILFNRGKPMAPVFGFPVNQNAVYVYQQHLDTKRSAPPSLRSFQRAGRLL